MGETLLQYYHDNCALLGDLYKCMVAHKSVFLCVVACGMLIVSTHLCCKSVTFRLKVTHETIECFPCSTFQYWMISGCGRFTRGFGAS